MTRAHSFLALPLLAATLAQAEVPSSVLFQGYLASNGTPLNGPQTLLVKACDAVVDGNCKTVFNDKVQASNGYYSALLQSLPAMDKPYWLEVASNGSLLPDRIALTATPYALHAAVADSAAKSLSALNADLATRAKLADSAVAALQAVNATLAAKASLADSAVSALRAVNALLAAKALLADSATGALRAQTAINSVNATNAVNAISATNAVNATYAASMNGIAATTDSLRLSKPYMKFTNGTLSEILNETGGTGGGKRAGVRMDLTSSSTLHLYASGWGATSGASSSLDITPAGISTTDPVATGDLTSSGTVKANFGLALPPVNVTSLPACNEASRGLIFMVNQPSSYTADVLTWCQFYGNPGGSGYRWVYLDYGMFEVR